MPKSCASQDSVDTHSPHTSSRGWRKIACPWRIDTNTAVKLIPIRCHQRST